MEIEFEDSRLALIETDAAADARLPVAVIHSTRQRLAIIRAAPDVRTLRSWKSLYLHEQQKSSEYQIVLSSDWSIKAKIVEKNSVMTVIVTSIERVEVAA